MTLWQLARVTRFLNGEATRTVRSLQILETVDRNARRASCKLQQTGLALRWPATDALPEPLDDLIVDFVATVVRKLAPVVTNVPSVSELTSEGIELQHTHQFLTFRRSAAQARVHRIR